MWDRHFFALKLSHFPDLPPNPKRKRKQKIKLLYVRRTRRRKFIMTNERLNEFREILRCLPFHGTTLKDFASKINLTPHTLYNYVCGQRPSEKNYRYILYVVEKDYPIALEQGKELAEKEENE